MNKNIIYIIKINKIDNKIEKNKKVEDIEMIILSKLNHPLKYHPEITIINKILPLEIVQITLLHHLNNYNLHLHPTLPLEFNPLFFSINNK
jgi:hypothetical protein